MQGKTDALWKDPEFHYWLWRVVAVLRSDLEIKVVTKIEKTVVHTASSQKR